MAESIPLLARASDHGDGIALVDGGGPHTYREVLRAARSVASCLLRQEGQEIGSRVAILAPPGLSYVAAMWGTWLAGGIAVPLCPSHPKPEIAYALSDSGARAVLIHPDLTDRLPAAPDCRAVPTYGAMRTTEGPLPRPDSSRRALILYTSGTTSRPKGAALTHDNLTAMVLSLVEGWDVRAHDRILHALPLHHAHGIVAALLTPLWAGAACVMLPAFDVREVWRRLSDVTLFMAVPTAYSRLLDAWDGASEVKRRAWSAAAGGLRMTVSGSAALPERLFRRWEEVTDQRMLERYGMTEIGMVLSNPLNGERRPGTVGFPLPGIEARLVDDDGRPFDAEEEAGEIQIRGPNVFKEYWNRPEATAEAFDGEWFRTGDMALRSRGYWRILGRRSVDIVKTGGYKVSALEVEEVVRCHPDVKECAVVGVADARWGESVAAVVVLRPGATMDLSDLRAWAKDFLALYKVPTRLRVLEALPRNVMGKVVKSKLRTIVREWEEV